MSKQYDTDTLEGRQELDAEILTFLRGQMEPVKAIDVRRTVGGTPAQVRMRLNHLIETGKVEVIGRAGRTTFRVNRDR